MRWCGIIFCITCICLHWWFIIQMIQCIKSSAYDMVISLVSYWFISRNLQINISIDNDFVYTELIWYYFSTINQKLQATASNDHISDSGMWNMVMIPMIYNGCFHKSNVALTYLTWMFLCDKYWASEASGQKFKWKARPSNMNKWKLQGPILRKVWRSEVPL